MSKEEQQQEWRVELLPIHGAKIVSSDGTEIVRDVYDKKYADQIVREHNAVAFAIRNGENWALGDWQNWLRNHALAEEGS